VWSTAKAMQANAMGMRAKIQTMDMKQTQTVRLLDVLRLIIWLDELPLIQMMLGCHQVLQGSQEVS